MPICFIPELLGVFISHLLNSEILVRLTGERDIVYADPDRYPPLLVQSDVVPQTEAPRGITCGGYAVESNAWNIRESSFTFVSIDKFWRIDRLTRV